MAPKFELQDCGKEAPVGIPSSSFLHPIEQVPFHFATRPMNLILLQAYGGVVIVVVVTNLCFMTMCILLQKSTMKYSNVPFVYGGMKVVMSRL